LIIYDKAPFMVTMVKGYSSAQSLVFSRW